MKKRFILILMLLGQCCAGCGSVEEPSVISGEAIITMPPVLEEKITPTPLEVVTETVELEEIIDKYSIANLLLLAKEPLGQTMYVWGGGWNEEDTGAGADACTMGVSPAWAIFAAEQDADYDYDDTRYQIHDGLDCSGYMGWLVYNVMETEDGRAGYVTKATDMAADFAVRGFGEFTPAEEVKDWQAGDIMSMKGHVWMALGMCEDGSVVLLHASPPGVMLSGTRLKDDTVSQAEMLANEYMSMYYPEWYERYPITVRDYDYLEKSSRMRWSEDVLSDEQGLRELSAEEVLQWLFAEVN
ncbi:MAG: hypothetical protein IJZ82_08195 [Lachnospiraceae bacterium]|nr:hypothetical protein [Lachnospiraceae bacterium]